MILLMLLQNQRAIRLSKTHDLCPYNQIRTKTIDQSQQLSGITDIYVFGQYKMVSSVR